MPGRYDIDRCCPPPRWMTHSYFPSWSWYAKAFRCSRSTPRQPSIAYLLFGCAIVPPIESSSVPPERGKSLRHARIRRLSVRAKPSPPALLLSSCVWGHRVPRRRTPYVVEDARTRSTCACAPIPKLRPLPIRLSSHRLQSSTPTFLEPRVPRFAHALEEVARLASCPANRIFCSEVGHTQRMLLRSFSARPRPLQPYMGTLHRVFFLHT
ncbi:hypothetical protein EJ02DRAFT_4455 [Clathrospora elynae]|uniref:Uncharacterized protein n=1 Tax=Clathrospora elynae TaxID=706981 RepID=A0A6A5T6H8_9PLEO|nr:hypothetical protein EJ02DRAFT_4455 [Clathrospora elynae]